MRLTGFYTFLSEIPLAIDNLTLRERIYIVLAVVVTLWGGWDFFIYSVNNQRVTIKQNKLADVQQQIQQTQASMEGLMPTVQNNSHVDNKNIISLKKQYTNLKKRVDSENLFSPQQMTQFLQKLLKQEKSVYLQQLSPLPVEVAFEGEKSKLEQRDIPTIYRHGFSIEFDSNYFDTVRYFKKLENLDKQFYWDSVQYQVDEYPGAKIKIFLHTLSLDDDWLGS